MSQNAEEVINGFSMSITVFINPQFAPRTLMHEANIDFTVNSVNLSSVFLMWLH